MITASKLQHFQATLKLSAESRTKTETDDKQCYKVLITNYSATQTHNLLQVSYANHKHWVKSNVPIVCTVNTNNILINCCH